MRHNQAQATPTKINDLIASAQTDPTAGDYKMAIHALWKYFGEAFTASLAKKSYLIDSDFNLKGPSFCSVRQSRISSRAEKFHSPPTSPKSEHGACSTKNAKTPNAASTRNSKRKQSTATAKKIRILASTIAT